MSQDTELISGNILRHCTQSATDMHSQCQQSIDIGTLPSGTISAKLLVTLKARCIKTTVLDDSRELMNNSSGAYSLPRVHFLDSSISLMIACIRCAASVCVAAKQQSHYSGRFDKKIVGKNEVCKTDVAKRF